MLFSLPRPRACASFVLGILTASSVISATTQGEALDAADVQVSTSATGSQDSAAVARDADGDFVVVWAGNGTELLQTDTSGVFAQRFDHNGVAQGGEMRVNTTTAGIQRNPAVAMDASGNFVVVWEGCDAGGTACDVFMQRYDAAGTEQDGETTVNTTTTDEQTVPTVAKAVGGAYVVAWQSQGQDGSGQGIYAKGFNADGSEAIAEFPVNTTVAFSQINPAAAIDVSGDFVIVWTSGDGAGQLNGVFGQRFAADGTPSGSEFRANVATAGDQVGPAVGIAGAGAFTIAWEGPDADGTGIFMRRYDSGGTALTGADEGVNATTTGNQVAATVAVDASGDVIVAWAGADADPFGIFFQRFNSAGAAQGAETPANATTTGDQAFPAVAADADGDFVVAWESFGQDGSAADSYGVFLERFSGPEDVDLAVTKTDSADPVTSGAPYSYTLTVENLNAASSGSGNGTVDAAIGTATGIEVEDILPAGVAFVSGAGTGWSCADAGGTVTCAYDTVLAPAGSASVTLAVTAPAGGGEIDNTATVSGDQFDSATANDAESEITYACTNADPGSVQFVGATFTVGEDGDDAGGNDDGLATITVTRSGGSCGTASVEVTSTNGTATDGQDYTGLAAPLTLNWGDGDTAAKTFTVAIAEDTAHEMDAEALNLALLNPERVTLGSQGTAVLNIVDNDSPPTATMSVTGSPFSENAGTATVTATLSKPAGRAVTVNLAYAAGAGADATGDANRGTGCGTTPTTPNDYTCSGTSISIAAGSSTGSVTLTGANDARDETDFEPAPITATCPTPNGESDADCTINGAAPQVAPQVQDDDAFPVVQFSAPSASVSEAQDPLNLPSQNRTATLTLQLSAVSDRSVTVDFTSAGTATKGATADFTLAPDSPGSFTFTPGQTSKAITATIIHDTVDEPDETVVVTLASPANATLGANNPHTLTITDDEAAPTVQFNPNTASVTEASANPLQVTATAQLSGTSSGDVTVPFTISGTATKPEDHDAQAGTITISAGATTGTYTYTIANDALDEAGETVVLTMGAPTGATAGANSTHTATIADDPADPLPVVAIDDPNTTVAASEAAGTAGIAVKLNAASGRTVSVAYTITGSAGSGSDYTLSPASPVTFAAGETSKVVTVTLINDSADETNNETLILTLNNPANATVAASPDNAHTLTITDDDDIPQVHFTDDAQPALEGDGSVVATVELSRTTNVDVTVPFTTGGSASANDYTLRCPDGLGGTQACGGEVIVAAGDTTAEITIQIAQDSRVEADEGLTLTIGTPVGATKNDPSIHTLTIQNDDTAGVTVNPVTADVIEGGAGDNYTLVLDTEPSADVTIDLTVGADATVSPPSVTFTAADWDTPKLITVNAVNDALAEGPHSDTITHAASSVDLDYQGISVADVDVSVTDNDTPAIALTESGGSTQVTEGGATDSYTFVLTTQPTADVVITVTAGAQVLRSPPSVTFTNADWNTPKTVTITADNDLVAEGAHAGTATHSVASADADYDNFTVRAVQVSITDNDNAGVTVTQSSGSTAVTEGGATDTYTLVLTSEPTADVTVNLTVGADVTVNPSSVAFTAVNWNLGRTITVTAVNDSLVEGAHGDTVMHAVSSADGFYDAVAVDNVSVTVTDNDTAGLVVTESGATTTVAEGGATDTFTVALSSQPLANVTVAVDPDLQLSVSAATLTFTPANFAVAQTVTVTAVNDGSAEAAHSGSINLSSSSTDATFAGLSGSVVAAITDNDQVAGGEDAPGVVVTATGGTVNVASNQSEGGALSHGALLGLLGLFALRRRRSLQAAALAVLGLGAGSAAAADLPYQYADLRYISADADPDVSVSGFSLAGSMLVKPTVFLTGSYGIADTDDFRVQGVSGSVKSSSLSLGGGLRRAFNPKLDGTASLSVVYAKSEGEGGFAGSTSDTGFALEAGLRGWFTPKAEWGTALNYLAIFDDGTTSLNAQALYHVTPRFALALGTGFSADATQFNLGARIGFGKP